MAVATLVEVSSLRAESIRGQLEGSYPSTLAQQAENPGAGVDASHVDLRNLGDFQDLENAAVYDRVRIHRIGNMTCPKLGPMWLQVIQIVHCAAFPNEACSV